MLFFPHHNERIRSDGVFVCGGECGFGSMFSPPTSPPPASQIWTKCAHTQKSCHEKVCVPVCTMIQTSSSSDSGMLSFVEM